MESQCNVTILTLSLQPNILGTFCMELDNFCHINRDLQFFQKRYVYEYILLTSKRDTEEVSREERSTGNSDFWICQMLTGVIRCNKTVCYIGLTPILACNLHCKMRTYDLVYGMHSQFALKTPSYDNI